MVTRNPTPGDSSTRQRVVQARSASIVRLADIDDVLGADTLRCLEQWASIAKSQPGTGVVSSPDYQFSVRSLVRAFFAQVEGLTYAMRAAAVAAHESGLCPLTPQEVVLLREERYRFDAKRKKIVISPSYNRPLENVILAFQVYPRIFGETFEMPLGDNGWERFQRSMKLRDALVHPKDPTDLEISAKVALDLVEAVKWFGRTVTGLLSVCRQALRGED